LNKRGEQPNKEINKLTFAISPAEEKFDRGRKTLGFLIGPLVFVFLYWWPMPSLSADAHRLTAILGLVLIYWVTEAIPIPVTALLGVVLCVIFGVAEAKIAFAPFSAPIIFLFIGSFMLAEAMMVHKLDQRLALTILSWPLVANSPTRIILSCGAISTFFSMWISNTATTAMMFPIVLGILRAMTSLSNKKAGGIESKYATGAMLTIAYAASIGGIGTPIGTAPNLIGIGMINNLVGVKIPFFTWMLLGIPLIIFMYPIFLGYINWLYPSQTRDLSGLRAYLRKQRQELGSWTRGQVNVLVAFCMVVSLWLLPGFIALFEGSEGPIYKICTRILPEGVVAILGATLLFFLPINWKEKEFTLSWHQAVQIDWGTLLLFGGGLSLGSLTFSTKLADIMGQKIIELTGAHSLWGITAVATTLAIILTETTSNTASASMVIPIFIAIAKSVGVSAIPPALGACLGCSLAFMLPVSTPPNAIVYGSGLIPITKMIKTGIVLEIYGIGAIVLTLRILCPLLGLS
jgi:sodium-dependent dicarboxylate transporter 2/3/5